MKPSGHLVGSVNRDATLNHGDVGLNPMLGVEITLKKEENETIDFIFKELRHFNTY